ncbi:hypothetical protein WJX77_010065 [Trebouxia sp. C0004]
MKTALSWIEILQVLTRPALLAEKRDGSRKAYHTTGLGASQLWTKRLDSGPLPGLTVELAELYIDDIKATAERTAMGRGGLDYETLHRKLSLVRSYVDPKPGDNLLHQAGELCK